MLPRGFKVSGISAQIKKNSKNDLGLIYSEVDCIAAAAFTKNKVKAEPIIFSKNNLKNTIRAVLVNSGNANCFTGKQAQNDVVTVARKLAAHLNINIKNILMASTGIIGVRWPKEKILSSLEDLISNLSQKAIRDFASSILTTDKFSKIKSVAINLSGKKGIICGIAKGAGMIYPHLEIAMPLHATMLCFILTDVAISRKLLNLVLKEAVEKSFNSISVDGCMSTNDSVFLLTNGLAANDIIRENNREFQIFRTALIKLCQDLAKMIVLDAEGATKFITIRIEKAKSVSEAKKAGFAIANSNLFKCAIHGGDPNWGRIVAALGADQINFDLSRLDIFINNKRILKNSRALPVLKKITGKNVDIRIVLNSGNYDWVVYSSDLSKEYIDINSCYS